MSGSSLLTLVSRFRRRLRLGAGIGLLLWATGMPILAADGTSVPEVIELGARRELFVDHFLIDVLDGAALVLHQPTPRNVAVVHDEPWEGCTSGYHTVFRDTDRYRMYYRGSHFDRTLGKTTHRELTCYAESTDGIAWTKPELGLFEFNGSTANNIVWDGPGTHNFAPFRDTNPACPERERYKALGFSGEAGGLLAFVSPDGIHWELLREEAVITNGAFDSQNLAFWDCVRERYVEFHRHFTNGVRAIMTCTSADFRTWTEPVWVQYPDGTPNEHLYTNQTIAYHRAAHIFMAFPKRFVPSRTYPGNTMPGLSDGVFMTSRDGILFHRWLEAFIRPGPQRERWVNRNNMTAWGVVQTRGALPGCPDELSLYSTEGYYQGNDCRIRRLSLRLDGFVSVNAPMHGGTMTTKPFTFAVSEPAGRTAPLQPPPLPLELSTEAPLRGAGSMVFDRPVILDIEGTQNLGPEVTLAVLTRDIRPGHRRLFSAYNGGAIQPGDQELVFDVFVGGAFADGSVLRFLYDGLSVTAGSNDIPGWNDLVGAGRLLHLAATYNDGRICLYVNGKQIARGGESGHGNLSFRLGPLRFGEDYPPTSLSNEAFLGTADDILVLRRTLAPEELQELAANGAGTVVDTDTDSGVLYGGEPGTQAGLTDALPADGTQHATIPGMVLPGDVQLLLNASTSAAGAIRCELRDAAGRPLPGFALADCDPFFGDTVERPVSWHGRTELKPLAGTPIRLHVELRDADLYAIRFGIPE